MSNIYDDMAGEASSSGTELNAMSAGGGGGGSSGGGDDSVFDGASAPGGPGLVHKVKARALSEHAIAKDAWGKLESDHQSRCKIGCLACTVFVLILILIDAFSGDDVLTKNEVLEVDRMFAATQVSRRCSRRYSRAHAYCDGGA